MQTMLEFQRFNPENCDFPSPRVPVLPPLQWPRPSSQADSGERGLTLPAGAQRQEDFVSGRYALAQAYRLSGVGPQGALLAPAYHCRTMLDPAQGLGAPVLLYPLDADLAPRLDALSACVADSVQPVRALLLPHYFGRAQSSQHLDAIVRFCALHDITLIEDCAHALLWSASAGRMGHAGRFGVASPYKFFSCPDGGILWSNQTPLPARAAASGWLRNLSAWLDLLKPQRPAPRLDLTALPGQVAALSSSALPPGGDTRGLDAAASKHYSPRDAGRRSLASSRWIFKRTDIATVMSRRQQRYRQWLAAVSTLPHCRALIPDWPEQDIPYMFPLLIDHPYPHFHALKQLGMPIWRWDEMAVSDCPRAQHYRLHLLHLPCHQSLSDAQMQWMMEALSQVMRMDPAPKLGYRS